MNPGQLVTNQNCSETLCSVAHAGVHWVLAHFATGPNWDPSKLPRCPWSEWVASVLFHRRCTTKMVHSPTQSDHHRDNWYLQLADKFTRTASIYEYIQVYISIYCMTAHGSISPVLSLHECLWTAWKGRTIQVSTGNSQPRHQNTSWSVVGLYWCIRRKIFALMNN